MKIKLLSNFHDYYDHHFDIDGVIFDRRDNIGMNRIEMFQYFKKKNILCPLHGKVEDVVNKIKKDIISNSNEKIYNILNPDVVVYLDNNSHRGENKIKVSSIEALDKYKDYFCSQFIYSCPNFENFSISIRSLHIGNKVFVLEYSNKNNWKSNEGENVEIKIVGIREYEKNSLLIDYPLFAIDYIESGKDFYAIDFNQSPRIIGTGIEDLLKPKEVRRLIEDRMKERY